MLKHTRKMLHFSAISLWSGRILKLYSQVLIRCKSYSSSQSYSVLVAKQSLSEDKYLTNLKLNFLLASLQSKVRKFLSEINLKNLSILSHPIHHSSLLTFVKHWPFFWLQTALLSRKEINRYHMMMHKLLSGSFWWETSFWAPHDLSTTCLTHIEGVRNFDFLSRTLFVFSD